MPNWKKVIVSGSDAVLNNITASGHLTVLNDGFTVNENDTTELYVDGDIIATGDIIAENYIISSSVTYMTQSFSDGSTIFGDDPDLDTHIFTGSLFITGITYDDTPQPAAAVLIIDTASGQLYYTGSYGGGGTGGEDDDWHIDTGNNRLTSSLNILVKNNITASGAISASSVVHASGYRIGGRKFANPSTVDLFGIELGNGGDGNIRINHLTASGDISASGNLFALVADNDDTAFKTVMYDTSTGKFFRTGSYSGGGGNLQTVTDNGEVTTNGGVFWSGQNYRWGGWTSQATIAGFQSQSSATPIAYTRVTPQRAGGAKWNLIGNMQYPDGTGRLDPRNWLVFEPNLYVVGDEVYNSGGNVGTPEDDSPGGIGGLVIENGGLQIKERSSSIDPAAISLVPGNEGPGIYFFERGSTTADTSGSINHNSASARLVFDTSSQAIQFQAGSTDIDLVQVMHISHSGDNPSIGIGTNTPKAALDIEEIEDSTTGTRILLKSARTSLGAQVGDAAGSIIFAIDSGSFNDIFSTGSVAEISTIVKGTQTGDNTDNMSGNLIFKSSPEYIETLTEVAEIGHFHFDNLNPSEDSEPGMIINGQLTVGSGSGWQSQAGDVAFSVHNVDRANMLPGNNLLKFRITGSNAVIHSGSLTIGSGSLFLGETYSGANQVEVLNLRGQNSIKLGHISGGGGNHPLEIYTANGQLAAKFDNSQNLGIGTSANTAPERLTVEGNISASGNIIGSNLSGTNTGDQDLSSYSTIVQLNASSSALQTNIDTKVDTTGTPANNQLAIFTDSDTIEGDSDLTWDGSTFTINGTGSVDLLQVDDKLQGNGSGFQFFAFNEDTVKVKFANWYSSNTRQYGMGQLWYETWFAAIDDQGVNQNRRIGFYLEEPDAGSTDSGTPGQHPSNARFYVDITGSYIASGGLHVTDADFEVSSTGHVTASGNISSSGDIIGATGSFDVINGGTF